MTTLPHPFRTVGLQTHSHQSAKVQWIGAMPTLVKSLLAIDLVLGGLYLLSYAIFHYWLPAGYHLQEGGAQWNFKWLSSVFDLDSEMNIPTWYSSAQLFITAGLLSIFAWAKWDRKQLVASLGLIAAAGLFFLFSCDEVATLHENIGGKFVHYLKAQNHDSVFRLFAFWIAILVPTLGLIISVTKATAIHWRGRPQVAAMFAIGMFFFLGSAVGFELVWAAVTHGNPSDSPIEVFIEEVGEMIGQTLLVWAAWELLRSGGVRLTVELDSKAVARERIHQRLKELAARRRTRPALARLSDAKPGVRVRAGH